MNLNFFSRCQSTLDMSEFDKSKVRSSPKSNEAIFLEQQKSTKKLMDDLKSSAAAEEESDKREKYRKCSSLRSGKTPPGTPARRKIVRYRILTFKISQWGIFTSRPVFERYVS
jgi:hypothetical protein